MDERNNNSIKDCVKIVTVSSFNGFDILIWFNYVDGIDPYILKINEIFDSSATFFKFDQTSSKKNMEICFGLER